MNLISKAAYIIWAIFSPFLGSLTEIDIILKRANKAREKKDTFSRPLIN